MPAAIRYEDICKGHDGFAPRPNDEASQDVFINGLGAHRVEDHWVTHCNPVLECHDSRAKEGCPNVFVNGRQLCRENDKTYCGSPMGLTKSPDVFVNDRG